MCSVRGFRVSLFRVFGGFHSLFLGLPDSFLAVASYKSSVWVRVYTTWAHGLLEIMHAVRYY